MLDAISKKYPVEGLPGKQQKPADEATTETKQRLPGSIDPTAIYVRGQQVFKPETLGNIYNSVFGSKSAPAPEKTDAELARENVDNTLAAMFQKRRDALAQQKDENMRVARYRALGDALVMLGQMPVSTLPKGMSGAPTYDNRQYLDYFNKAVKANDDLRNIGVAEEQYNLNRAEQEYQRQLNLADAEVAARRNAEIKAAEMEQKHQYDLENIAARGDYQKQVAEIRNHRITTKDGKPITEQDLKTAKTQWYRYLGRYWDDLGRGVPRKELNGPLTLAEFLTTPDGGSYSVDSASGSTGSASGNGNNGNQNANASGASASGSGSGNSGNNPPKKKRRTAKNL